MFHEKRAEGAPRAGAQAVVQRVAEAVAHRRVVRHALRARRRKVPDARLDLAKVGGPGVECAGDVVEEVFGRKHGAAVGDVADGAAARLAELDAGEGLGGAHAGGVAGGECAAGGVAVRVEARRAVLDVVPAA